MTIAVQYCPSCGSGNLLSNEECFACHYPLTPPKNAAKPQETLLRGRYRLLNILGVGGFGMVYRAIDAKAQNRVVAIKQTNISSLNVQQTMDATDTFHREVKLLSTVNHPQLPRIYNYFADPDHWYLVINFIEGDTLESLITKNKNRMPVDEIFALGIQLCDILHYLHTHNPVIIYRDLKPANIMRNEKGVIFLIDFGTARFVKTGQAKDTIPLGSPGYASPEQYGKVQTSPRSDIYSLGAVLHQLFTGDDPAIKPFAFKPVHRPDIVNNVELGSLIISMLAPEPVKRPKTMMEVKERLNHLRKAQYPDGAAPLISYKHPGRNVSVPLPQALEEVTGHLSTFRLSRRATLLLSGVALAAVVGGTGYTIVRLTGKTNVNGTNALPPLTPDSRTIQTATNLPQVVSSVVCAPDAAHIAVIGLDSLQQHIFQVWNSATGGASINSINSNAPLSAIWAPDKTTIATINSNGSLTAWNSSNATKQFTIILPQIQSGTAVVTPVVTNARWSADQSYLAILDDHGNITTWNGYNGQSTGPNGILKTGTTALALAWSPQNHMLAVTTSDDTLQILDIDNNAAVVATATPQSTTPSNGADQPQIANLSWSSNSGSYLVTGYQQQLAVHAVDGKNLTWKYAVTTPHELDFSTLVWSKDGRYFACLDKNLQIVIYDITTGNQLNQLLEQTNATGGLAWSQTQNDLEWITCDTEITIQTWHIATN